MNGVHAEIQFCRPELVATSVWDDENGYAHLTLKDEAAGAHVTFSDTRAKLRSLTTKIRAALGEQPSGGLREGYTHGPYWLEQQEGGALRIMGWDPDTENWPVIVATVEVEEDAVMILDRLGYRRTTIPACYTGVETPCPVCKYPVRVQRTADGLNIDPTCDCLGNHLVDAIGYHEEVEKQVRLDGRIAA